MTRPISSPTQPDTAGPDSAEPDDAALLALVRGGDLDAYAVLYERHRPAALRLARTLAGPAGADDLVAEAFLRTLRLLGSDRGPDRAFRGYVLTAVRNIYYTLYRTSLRIVPVEDVSTVVVEQGVDPYDSVIEDQLVAAALASLPPRQQLVIRLATLEELPLDEVARRLEISTGAVGTLAYRAREALRMAYLEQHARAAEAEECRAVVPLIARGARSGTPPRRKHVEKHLESCSPCRSAQTEILAVARTFRSTSRTR
ncbi:MAG TPA: RNA polymerase sigma factor [Marmoricola sp.]|jgi:RNA polymerase sigma factor (sigma-70 family)|nr:RNA polymerase sigma factor [Marmoricola sp.]